MRLVTGEKIRVFAEENKIPYFNTHNLNYVGLNKLQASRIVLHNSDGCILDHRARDCDFYFIENAMPKKSILFCQNMDVLSDRVRPLPIGLENTAWHKGNKFKEIEAVMKEGIPRKNWLYVNHEIATNPNEREASYRIFKNLGFATTVFKKKSYLDYIKDMKAHKFVLCPEGNGFDTHRAWEALYMGAIPIVKKRVFTEMFSRIMPMFIVEDWKMITLDFLKNVYNKMSQIKWPYGDQYLDMGFWEKVIKGEIKIC